MQKRKMQKIQETARTRKKEKSRKEEKGLSQTSYDMPELSDVSSLPVTAEQLLKILRSGQKPVRLDQILRIADIPRRQKKTVEALLYSLAKEGRLMRVHGGQWVISDQIRTFVGRYSVQRSGVGFVDMAQPENAENASGAEGKGKKNTSLSIFIHPSQAGEAWHGDTVRVALLPKTRGGERRGSGKNKASLGSSKKEGGHASNPEGRIVEVLERNIIELMMRIDTQGSPAKRSRHNDGYAPRNKRQRRTTASDAPTGAYMYGTPCDMRFSFSLRVPTEDIPAEFLQDMAHNALLLVRPTHQVGAELWEAEVISAHGREDDVAVQEELVKINHQCPDEFPPTALEEANALPPQPHAQDYAFREDLRHLPFVTIDGETARDFDDAIYVQPLKSLDSLNITESGGWSLHVAIADVTHYVPQHSALDKEAKRRGNSWYFPQSVEPMFPKSLSNGLCSLNPHQDRLVMVAHMHFDAHGQRTKSNFYASVIHSHARLTYTQVKDLVLDNDASSQEKFITQPHGQTVLDMLRHAEALARSLEKMRLERGTLDFHRPEPEYHFDTAGHITAITRKEEHFAHKLIEECMIAANEAVAEFLEKKDIPFLYRVHPEPEDVRLEGLFRTLASTSLAENLPRHPKAQDLQSVLHAAQGNDEEFVVGRLALRTMPQARYQPENTGHFGLASTCYCHFTSPIRRYADMVVHRALKYALRKQLKSMPEGFVYDPAPLPEAYKLLALGDGLNVCERASMEAEREMARRLAVLIMQGHEGQDYTGIIAGVSDFGIFVELDSMPVEGMVPIRALGDDFFEFDVEKQELIGVMTGARFALGHRVQVRLIEANLGRLEITFSLREAPSAKGARKGGKGQHLHLPRKQAAKLRQGQKKSFFAKKRRR